MSSSWFHLALILVLNMFIPSLGWAGETGRVEYIGRIPPKAQAQKAVGTNVPLLAHNYPFIH